MIKIARKAVSRCDTTYIAGCLFRAVEICAHALHGHAGRWLISEKGAIDSAGQLAEAPLFVGGTTRGDHLRRALRHRPRVGGGRPHPGRERLGAAI
jgi:hypothetical protein